MVMTIGQVYGQKPKHSELRSNPTRLENRIKTLGQFGRNPEGGVSRVAYSEADLAGRKYVMGLMKEAGLKVRVDPAGNIFGRRPGKKDSKVILFGSHIDSVPNGGNYDGPAGVLTALECIEVLNENSVQTDHPLEVVVFTDEEGGLIGSRAVIGKLNQEALDFKSHSGRTIREGITGIGGDPDRLPEAVLEPDDLLAFLELHIEQGSILDDEGIDIGVVQGIVGIEWWEIAISGFANHAGTTPMNKRQDALLAAAKLVQVINTTVTGVSGNQVGTVGRIKAFPGAPNVIPGRVEMSLELRDLSAEKIMTLFESIKEEAKKIADESGVSITFTQVDFSAEPAMTDPRIKDHIRSSARNLSLSYKDMPSGAGHDAQDLARITPTAMIFIPSKAGISHSPQEYSTPASMANGANVLLHTILALDQKGL